MNLKKILDRSLGIFRSDKENADSYRENWFVEQRRKLETGEEIEPPWVAFPNSSPVHGWNQGWQEEWRSSVWIPFWQNLNAQEQKNYLDKWRTSDEWRESLTVYWIGDKN